MNKLLRWKRGSDGYLFLQVYEDNNWISYTQATHKRPDYQMPGIVVSKGFSTAQRYLELGYSYVKFEENYNE